MPFVPNARSRDFRLYRNTPTITPIVTSTTMPTTTLAMMGSLGLFFLLLVGSAAGSINKEKSVRCVQPQRMIESEAFTARQPSVLHTFEVVSVRESNNLLVKLINDEYACTSDKRYTRRTTVHMHAPTRTHMAHTSHTTTTTHAASACDTHKRHSPRDHKYT